MHESFDAQGDGEISYIGQVMIHAIPKGGGENMGGLQRG